MAVGQEEDNVGTETVVLRRFMGMDQPEQFLAFSLQERACRWLGTWHIRLLGLRSVMAQKAELFYIG
jgi:hypothetical protein